MKAINQLLYFAIAIFIIISCDSSHENPEQESDFTVITNQQFETDSMQLGKIETKLFENIVKCSGTIVPLPNGIAKVNVPLNGIIKSINCYNGESVDRNQPLIEIAGNEIIEIQKEFAEISANYRRLKIEYERIKSLYKEKVTAEKDFILAETEFKASMARYSGLKLKLESIGLSTLQIENGEFYASYHIKSPIKGYISNFNASIGSYIDSQVEILEIINPDMLQVKLSVFANEIVNLRKDQSVRFASTNSGSSQLATISSIGITIDDETKSVPCYANILNKNTTALIVNSYVEGEIIVSIDTANVLPKSAIIKSKNNYFILVLSKQLNDRYIFKKQPVSIGREFKDYFEIINDRIDGMILIKGVYFIGLDE